MKIVKIAVSPAMRENIPTRPREGSVQGVSVTGMLMGSALMYYLRNFDSRLIFEICQASLNYSYLQSGSSACLRSQSGRRLCTSGMTAKLYAGGGDAVDHSKVQASHGSLPAGRPRK